MVLAEVHVMSPPDRLCEASRPVLDRLGDELTRAKVAVFLADADGRVVDWRLGDLEFRAQLNRMLSARDFLVSLGGADTTVIGTVLEHHEPSVLEREEHFADGLINVACAAAPIRDPHTGRVCGVLDLAAVRNHACPLMLAVATGAARDIERRLLDDGSVAEQVLLDQFVQARRRAKGPLVSLNHRNMTPNAAASRILHPSDRDVLWERASRSLGRRQPSVSTVRLRNGISVNIRVDPVSDGADVVGALIHLDPSTPSGPKGLRPTFGWDSLTDTERGLGELVALGMTNREVATRLFLSPHTVGNHLRLIFRKLDITSRVQLARLITLHHDQSRDTDT